MPFNWEKCAHIKIGKTDESYLFGDNTIESAATQNDLCLIFSRDLKWNLHIDKASAKAINVSFMIKNCVSDLPTKTRLELYKSMIVPILVYGSPCYGLSRYVMTQLENVQKRVVK